MLKNSFFTISDIQKNNDGSSVVAVHLNETHPVYVGHFPGKPVCPGVMTLTVVRECIEEIIGRELSWTAIKSSRFTGMMFPGDDIIITVSLTPNETTYIVKADIQRPTNQELSLLSLSATLA